jgi:hypothetical protein
LPIRATARLISAFTRPHIVIVTVLGLARPVVTSVSAAFFSPVR